MSQRSARPPEATPTASRLGRAALFCVGCALGAVIAVCITLALVRRANEDVLITGADGALRFSVGLADGKYAVLELKDANGKSQRAEMDTLPDGTVQIVLSDRAGARRLRLAVDGSGEPSIQLLNKDGRASWKVP